MSLITHSDPKVIATLTIASGATDSTTSGHLGKHQVAGLDLSGWTSSAITFKAAASAGKTGQTPTLGTFRPLSNKSGTVTTATLANATGSGHAVALDPTDFVAMSGIQVIAGASQVGAVTVKVLGRPLA